MMKSKQFVVIGLGRFGTSVCKTLHELGYEVLGIDQDAELVQSAHDEAIATDTVQLDATHFHALEDAGIAEFDTAVISIGTDLESSILTLLNLLELKLANIIAKATDDRYGQVLSRIGGNAVRVVYPEREMGERLAWFLSGRDFLDSIQLSPDYCIVEIFAPQEFQGKTLGEIDLQARFGIKVVAIKGRESLNMAPSPDDCLQESDTLILLGPKDSIHKLKHGRR